MTYPFVCPDWTCGLPWWYGAIDVMSNIGKTIVEHQLITGGLVAIVTFILIHVFVER
jgi:hypothetical protein